MKPTLLLILFLAVFAVHGSEVIVQWTFNSTTPDAAPATGSLLPAVGRGTATAVGGVSSSFATGDTAAGRDPSGSVDNSGWQTSGYPASGTGNLSAGVRFDIDTTGYESLFFSWSQRHSSTASRYFRLQYTLDGLNFTDADLITVTADSVFATHTADLASIAGASNNPLFALRLVAEFESTAAGGTESFVATKNGGTYAPGGTVRFDMVTLAGTLIAGANTPPQISQPVNQVLRLGQTSGPIPFTISDAEDAAEALQVRAVSSDLTIVADDAISFSGSAGQRSVSLRAGSQPGTTTITLTVSDLGGRWASSQFVVEVLPLNTAPTISKLSRTNTLSGTPVTIPFQVSDLESSFDALSITPTSANPVLVPNASITIGKSGTNRTLTLTPTPGQTGVSPITLRVSDGTLESAAVFPLLVTASPSVLLDEPFAYAEGSLLTNSTLWTTRSGVAGQCQVQGGQLFLSAASTEDVVAPLIGSPYVRSNGTVLYAAFRLKALALPRVNPGLLAHFADGSTLRGRVYVGTTNAAPGRFRVFVGNGSDAVTEFPGDFETNTFYTVVTRYEIDAASTRLWVGPAAESDASVDAADPQSAARLVSYGFRQDSDIGGTFVIANLKIGLSFPDVLSSEPLSAGRLRFNRENGVLVLSWDTGAILQSGTSPAGPFADIPEALSPYHLLPDAEARFFRLRR